MEKEPILWEKFEYQFLPGLAYTMGFVGYYQESIPQAFPIQWVWLSFPMLLENDKKTHAFPM